MQAKPLLFYEISTASVHLGFPPPSTALTNAALLCYKQKDAASSGARIFHNQCQAYEKFGVIFTLLSHPARDPRGAFWCWPAREGLARSPASAIGIRKAGPRGQSQGFLSFALG